MVAAREADASTTRPTRPFQDKFSFSFSSRWLRGARRGPYALRPVSQQSPQGSPLNSACLNTDRSRPWNVGRFLSPLLFPSGHHCCGALTQSMFLKPLSTSAPPSCRPDVLSAVLASLSAQNSRWTEVFVAEDCLAVCQSGQKKRRRGH